MAHNDDIVIILAVALYLLFYIVFKITSLLSTFILFPVLQVVRSLLRRWILMQLRLAFMQLQLTVEVGGVITLLLILTGVFIQICNKVHGLYEDPTMRRDRGRNDLQRWVELQRMHPIMRAYYLEERGVISLGDQGENVRDECTSAFAGETVRVDGFEGATLSQSHHIQGEGHDEEKPSSDTDDATVAVPVPPNDIPASEMTADTSSPTPVLAPFHAVQIAGQGSNDRMKAVVKERDAAYVKAKFARKSGAATESRRWRSRAEELNAEWKEYRKMAALENFVARNTGYNADTSAGLTRCDLQGLSPQQALQMAVEHIQRCERVGVATTILAMDQTKKKKGKRQMTAILQFLQEKKLGREVAESSIAVQMHNV